MTTPPTAEQRLQQFSDMLASPMYDYLTAWERHKMYAAYALSKSLTECPEPTPDELEPLPPAGYGKRRVRAFREERGLL